jgi:SAM-dependent methyltransferase
VSKEQEYILGTHDAELARLGLQHSVWRPHASRAWREAGFTAGQTLLDVGCGPGYAALDLATITGPSGRVVAVDRSRRFLDALSAAAHERGIAHVETHELDLDVDPLPDLRADGAWTRWVLSFVSRPEALVRKIAAALRPGGTIVLHEYVNYGSWRLSTRSEAFESFVREVMASWRDAGGEADIGLDLPAWLEAAGVEVLSLRPISEAARPNDYLWQWPQAFVGIGLARLVELGRIDAARVESIRRAFDDVAKIPGGFVLNPTVLEVIARRRGRA